MYYYDPYLGRELTEEEERELEDEIRDACSTPLPADYVGISHMPTTIPAPGIGLQWP